MVLGDLCKDPDSQFHWKADIGEVFVMMRAYGKCLRSLELLKNNTLPDTASSKALPCVYVLIAYSMTYDDFYLVPFREANRKEILGNM